MSKQLVTIIGKAVKTVARLRGGGSALPGLVVEHIDPNFISKTLSHLPMGVVVISGTNGKTTTTKMVVELLESQGLKVFTNRTGSNFTRGVAAALLGEIDIRGNLHADIAVLELDEAHAVHFVDKIAPRYSLILNVMRDQLDRFGEVDKTASLLQHIALSTTKTVVLNREDTLIAKISDNLSKKEVRFFGLNQSLRSLFPNDDEFHSTKPTTKSKIKADVVLTSFSNNLATYEFDNKSITTKLKINGIYNVFNSAAALTLVRAILKDKIDYDKLIGTLSKIKPAFGRGESLDVYGQPLELILVKNPSGFRLGLKSFQTDEHAVMIAINDNYADGRDMSWLWDVDFSSLKTIKVSQVSGTRAYDMALRLQYDDVETDFIDTNLKKSLNNFLNVNIHVPKRIYCTYTAMLTIRKSLAKITNVKRIIK